MSQPFRAVRVFLFVCLFAVLGLYTPAQTPNISSAAGYDAILNILIGSNNAVTGAEIPRSLSPVQRQLRDNFAFTNYRLTNTLFSRVATAGAVEYKSVSDVLGKESGELPPTFIDWAFQLRPPEAVEGDRLLLNMFRFGARVPINISRSKGPDGQSTGVINYESVGLTTQRMTLPVGKPALIGTVSLPGTAGTLFIVMTLRRAAD
jgi:hypothetical protein